MSEELCLKWNDFQENVNQAFSSLREDKDLSDVTLACEDGQQVEAHKVVLATSSPVFQNLLKKNRHPHPLIYMKGFKFENLLAIIDFLYCGEANVFQEDLDAFLAIAEELELKGLTGQKHVENRIEPKEMTSKLNLKMENWTSLSTQSKLAQKKNTFHSELSQERILSVHNFVSADVQELDAKVKSMMEKSQNMASGGKKACICKVCGKEGQWVAIRDHIEANHLEGVTLPCSACGKMFRSRARLRKHKCSIE